MTLPELSRQCPETPRQKASSLNMTSIINLSYNEYGLILLSRLVPYYGMLAVLSRQKSVKETSSHGHLMILITCWEFPRVMSESEILILDWFTKVDFASFLRRQFKCSKWLKMLNLKYKRRQNGSWSATILRSVLKLIKTNKKRIKIVLKK